jgi:hypothetical protein
MKDPYQTGQNVQAGLDRYEADFAFYHQLQGAGAAWNPSTKIQTPYNLFFKRIYLNVYNDAGTANSYASGVLNCYYNKSKVFRMPVTFTSAGTAPILSNKPETNAVLSSPWQTGAVAVQDNLLITRIGAAAYVQVCPIRLWLTCDEIEFEFKEGVASAGNACVFLACMAQRVAM